MKDEEPDHRKVKDLCNEFTALRYLTMRHVQLVYDTCDDEEIAYYYGATRDPEVLEELEVVENKFLARMLAIASKHSGHLRDEKQDRETFSKLTVKKTNDFLDEFIKEKNKR